MKTRVQKWLWISLAAVAAFQLYFVREMVAALILLGVVFAAFATLVLLLNLMHRAYERAFNGAEAFVRSEASNRPFRRLRSVIAR